MILRIKWDEEDLFEDWILVPVDESGGNDDDE